MPLPLLLIPLVAGGGGLSTATFLGSFTLGGGVAYGGYQAAPYLYNGIRDWIDPIRVDSWVNESLATLLKVKEEKEKERLHNLDETVDDIQQRKKQLDAQMDKQKNKHQEIMDSVDSDGSQIKEQTVQLKQINQGLEQTACAQEELITRLQQELQEKMVAFEEAQLQLAASDKRFEQAAKELTETKEQTAASKAELAQVKEELTAVVKENREKDSEINLLGKRVLAQEKTLEEKINLMKMENLALVKDLTESRQLIDDLSEQLELAQTAKKVSSSSRFFK